VVHSLAPARLLKRSGSRTTGLHGARAKAVFESCVDNAPLAQPRVAADSHRRRFACRFLRLNANVGHQPEPPWPLPRNASSWLNDRTRRNRLWSRIGTSSSPGSHAGEIDSQAEPARKADAGVPALSTCVGTAGVLTERTVPA
jgi:hypothetical protein